MADPIYDPTGEIDFYARQRRERLKAQQTDANLDAILMLCYGLVTFAAGAITVWLAMTWGV